jgi:hypothetical protein
VADVSRGFSNATYITHTYAHSTHLVQISVKFAELIILTFFQKVFLSSAEQSPRGLKHELSSLALTLRIVGSNPTGGMDVCVRLFCVFSCV